MLAAVVAFVSGCGALQVQGTLPDLRYAVLVAIVFFAASLTRRGSALRRWLFLVVWCGAGFFWAAALAHWRLSESLPPHWEGVDVAVTGVVATLPTRTERGVRFEFDVESAGAAPIPGKLLLTWIDRDGAAAPARPGERWNLSVRLRRPHGNANPHGFDYEAWLLARGIRATGYVSPKSAPLRLAAFVPAPGYAVERIREAVSARFHRLLGDAQYAGVLKALAIGETGAITETQWDLFRVTGVIHLISISGLHVTMVSGLVYALVLWLWRRAPRLVLTLAAQRAAALAGLTAAAAYVALAGFQVPAQRTLWMLAVVTLALYSGWGTRPSRVLAASAFVVVVLDPWAVISPGFWLSFGAVAAMMFVVAGGVTRRGWLRAWLSAQWAVTLALAPVLLFLFQRVSLVSPIANAFAIPLVSLVVTPLALLAAIPPFGFLLPAAHAAMQVCGWLLEWLARLPQATWTQAEPGTLALVLAGMGVVWLLLPRGVPARWLGVVCLLPVFLTQAPRPRDGEAWVDVLDVGQGLATVVRTRDHTLLYDAGPAWGEHFDGGARVVVPFLRGEGVSRLSGMVLSHGDADHTGGAGSVSRSLPVAWQLDSLPGGGPGRIRCAAGQAWRWNGVDFEVLHPTAQSYADDTIPDNDRSCVLKLSSRHGSALLTADIERIAELELTERVPEKLAAEVMTVPHHGSRTSSIPEFIAAVAPRIVIATAGYRNRFGHPRSDVVARYRARGVTVLRSDRDGDVILKFTAAGIETRTWRSERRRYWER